MTNLIVGLALGFLAGLAVGLAMGRNRKNTSHLSVQAATTGDASTPLLDSMLGIDMPVSRPAAPAPGNRAADLRQNLRVKMLYDEEALNRAISLERERSPQSSEEELIQTAIERWERQNR